MAHDSGNHTQWTRENNDTKATPRSEEKKKMMTTSFLAVARAFSFSFSFFFLGGISLGNVLHCS